MPHTDKIAPRKNRMHAFRAQLRDARVLLQESRTSLTLFVILIVAGTFIFHYLYHYPDGASPTFSESLYATFSLIFFQSTLVFPPEWYLQILFYFLPVVGLALVADGVLRFGTALFNKQERGQKWQVAMASIYRDHVIVCGLGRVGYRVVLELLRYGIDVVAIEKNEDGPFIEKVMALNVPVILADARRSGNLEKAGVDVADAIVPATDDQLANLEIALDAREIKPGIKVVMRMFDQEMARKIEKGFGIHTAFSSSALAAPLFAAAAMRLDIKHSFYVGDDLLNVSEVVIRPKSPLVGWEIGRIKDELDITVLFYKSKEMQELHPPDDLCLEGGDQILILASIETLKDLRKLNQGSER
jgi:Trk K+ transport system NAD-binding subunit